MNSGNAEARAKGRGAVIIVEDDGPLRTLLEEEIIDLGFGDVRACADADEAMAAMKEKSPTIVVTDLRMPGLDGIALTKWVKYHYPEAEVILITAFATVKTASEALRLGASDYLVKPFDSMTELAESLERALERIQEREQQQVGHQEKWAVAAVFGDLVDRLPIGVLLVDRRGRALHCNAAARVILDEHDGLGIDSDGALSWRSSTARSAFRKALRELESRKLDVAISLERSEERPPLTLHVASSPQTLEAGPGQPVLGTIIIYDPEQHWRVDEATLRELYGLTGAEAAVAALIMRGARIDEVAAELGVKTPTVRSHLKRVFSKTYTGRQGELVSLLLSGPALLCRSEVER